MAMKKKKKGYAKLAEQLKKMKRGGAMKKKCVWAVLPA